MPKLMLELVEAILALHPDLHVAGHVPADSNLRDAARSHRADILIVIQPNGAGSESNADRMFWRRPSKVIALAESGRTGVMYVLRPHATQLCELSVDNLVDAILSASPSEPSSPTILAFRAIATNWLPVPQAMSKSNAVPSAGRSARNAASAGSEDFSRCGWLS
jgi:hypothetical protein